MKKYFISNTENLKEVLYKIIDEAEGEKVKIELESGVYELSENIEIKNAENLEIYSNGGAFIKGSRKVRGFRNLNEDEKKLFKSEVRDNILVADLFTDGKFNINSIFGNDESLYSEAIADTKAYKLVRYPKNGEYLHIKKLDNLFSAHGYNNVWGVKEEGFYFEDETPTKWQLRDDVIAYGFWGFDWDSSYAKVKEIDKENKKIYLDDGSRVTYGFRLNQRFCFYNVMEELTEPGEFYIDKENGKIYIYPDGEFNELTVTSVNKPLFDLYDCENITFKNINISECCHSAVALDSCENINIDNCLFENIGGIIIDVFKGHNIKVNNNTMRNSASAGISFFGGNRMTLEPMNGEANNNHIYNIAKWRVCYYTPIHFCGVGMQALHNLIHDVPHCAIMFWGNDMIVENNEIYNAVSQTGDAGAIYTGRDYTFRGNRVCKNYIHHIGGDCDFVIGIYNDDCVCGTVMNDNIIESAMYGIQMGGGRDFMVKNNLFVKNKRAFLFDDRSTTDPSWNAYMVDYIKERFYHVREFFHQGAITKRNSTACINAENDFIKASEGVYIEKYPELKKYDELFRTMQYGTIEICGQAHIENNLFLNKSKYNNRFPEELLSDSDSIIDLCYSLHRDMRMINNDLAKTEDFEDALWDNFDMKRECVHYGRGYMPLTMKTFGLIESKRRLNPHNVESCAYYDKETNKVKIGLRNKKDEAVAGKLLFALIDCEVEEKEVEFTLNGIEEKWYEVTVKSIGEHPHLLVYSDAPGVRCADI